jgi:triosephosphate isomerase
MSARTPLIAGNWKMHFTSYEAREFADELCRLLDAARPSDVEVAVCPPFTAIEAAAGGFATSPVWIGAQDVHEEASGAHTGEVSVAMIKAAGAEGVIIGHSERRAMGESDARVAAKVSRALEAGLRVILCVGESLDQRQAGETEALLERQLTAVLGSVPGYDAESLVIAYEPIWAIGTGVVATPDQAQEACAHVRLVAANFVDGARVRVLYGGSVSPDNARELMRLPDVDGTLVGGASLDPEKFAQIIEAAT